MKSGVAIGPILSLTERRIQKGNHCRIKLVWASMITELFTDKKIAEQVSIKKRFYEHVC